MAVPVDDLSKSYPRVSIAIYSMSEKHGLMEIEP